MPNVINTFKVVTHQMKQLTATTFTHILGCLYYIFGILHRIYFTCKTSFILYKNFGSKVNKKVVIAGGGFAGSKIAQEVENYFTQVYLIDTKDYFEFTPSILRTLIDPNHINKIQFPHLSYLSSTKYINAKLTNISDNFVYLTQLDSESPSSLPYDYLILCTGSSYSEALFHPPFKVELPKEAEDDNKNTKNFLKEERFIFNANRASEIANCCMKIDKLDKILIIGGGTVAIELAGEILSKYATKEITIVHSGPDILHRYPQSVARHARSFLSSFPNTHVITGDRISHIPQNGRGKIKTDNGVDIETEIIFICTGIQPNSSYIHSKQPQIEIESPNDEKFIVDELNCEHRDERGFLKVNSFLQLNNKENIFVCGDVANTKEEKLAQSAQNSAGVVITNLIRSLKNRKLVEYDQTKSLPIVISLGNVDAIFVWRNLVLTGFIPALMKSFVEFKVLIAYFPPLLSFFSRG